LELIRRELIYFWYYFSIQVQQIAGYWVLGMVLGSLISVFGKEKIHALFAAVQRKKLGALGVIPASVIGIVSPLCMYGTIPIASSFADKGMEEDWLAAFMMSSILLNPQLLIYSAVLGFPAFMARLITCTLGGIAAGLCVRFFFPGASAGDAETGRKFFRFTKLQAAASRDTDPNPFLRFLKNLGRNLRATGLYFLAGVALSALFQRYVPAELMVKLFGGNRPLGLFLAATIGVPLYVCGGGTISLLLTWLRTSMSLGQAVSFMITGPATKITNLGALKIILGAKHFACYIVFTVVFALLSGLAADLVMRLIG
jgi:uncharacterized membrane protein YraQ (UPF0718 family)